ncbi:ChrR family anti-sigma-E factor [Rheinheimera salexigens]|uniref:Anti-sigma factor n=1 Tax=Rheinheimera salexigens TaxID=1628148 RepID=A0A1E7Q6W4_9GAMM|nr:ChrR family anti-sigma-E factor [Rheinheimera salexigens]OEY69925.1 anti-sigma factor [Rheinheimera salexigens]
MAHIIKHHPSTELLQQFTTGTLVADIALAIAAHVDMCPQCQQLSLDMANDIGTDIEQTVIDAPTGNEQNNWSAMLEAIMQQPVVTLNTAEPKPIAAVTVKVNQREFILPRALQRLATNHNKWLQLGGIASAKVPAGPGHHVSLLHIDKNTAVPQHTHLGLEITLILAGKIVDEDGEYGVGDLLVNSPDVTHTPRTLADEDCLCLSVLSAPLQFKKGLTRLLNPFQQFFY